MDLFTKKFTPMLLKEAEAPFDSNEHLYEIKFDGIRSLCFVNKDKIKLTNRHAEDITFKYPELDSIKSLVTKNTIFDGEIVIFDEGISSFEKIQQRIHLKDKNKIKRYSENEKVTFIVFDILYEGKDLTNLSLKERKEILNKYKDNETFIKSKCYYKEGTKLFEMAKKYNLEGIVAKNINSKYHINKRTDDWIKIKNLKEGTFTVCGYIENKDTLSLLLGELNNKMLFYVGKVSISKNNALSKVIKQTKITHNPFVNYDDKYAIFIDKKFKCSIEYLERTKENHLRHPIFKNLV